MARDTLVLLLARIFGLAFALLTGIIISRSLGPNLRGVYILVITVNSFMTNIGNLGWDFSTLYQVAKDRYPVRQMNGLAIVAAASLGSIFLLIYALFQLPIHTYVLRDVDQAFVFLALALVPASMYWLICNSIMAGLKRFPLVAAFSIGFSFSELALAFLTLILFQWGIRGLLIGWALEVVVLAAAGLYVISRQYGITFRFSRSLLREMPSFGLRGHLGNLAYRIYNRLDVFIVSSFTGAAGVGFYSLAISVAEKTAFLPTPLINAAIPRIGSASRSDAAALTSLIIRHTLFLSIGTGSLLMLLAPILISVLYGSDFRPSIVPALLLIPGSILILISLVISNFFTYQMGKPELPTLMAWLTLMVNIPLMFFFTARLGFVGAALATSLTYLFRFSLALGLFLAMTKQPWTKVLIISRQDLGMYFTLIKTGPRVLFQKAQEPFLDARIEGQP